MKARVKATGNIVDVEWYDHNSMGTLYADITHTTKDYEYELDFDTVYDYWTSLEHQYAGMAMQGMMAHTNIDHDEIVDLCVEFAHALVEKLKEGK